MTLLATMILIGASTPPKELKLEITGAALFKNGYAVVQREAAIPSSGEFVVKLLPQATYGTLWITTTAGTTVSDIATRNELRTTQGSLTTVASLLGENVGKTFTLELRDSGKVTGKLVSQSSEMVVVSDGKESHVVPLAEIRRVSTQEQLKTTWSGATADRVLQLRVDAGPGARVRITGLEAGLTWAPAYSLDIAKPDKAGLLAKATVVNELEDIADRELRLVTGYPNAAFSGSIDPLVSTSSVFQTAASGGQGGFGGAGGRGVTANQAVRFDANDQSLAFQPPAPASAEGASAEDLFLFPLAHVSLKKSDRGYFSLLQATIPYEHLYTWDAPESRVGNALGDPQQTSDQAGDVVWHSVRITNKANQPLTTGPAMVMDGEVMLGQSTLTYTPVGGRSIVQITRAVDVAVRGREEEVARERGALRLEYRGTVFDKLTIKGRLEIQSHKKGSVKMRVTKNLTGQDTTADHEGAVTKTAKNLADVNSQAHIEWNVDIKPGQTLELTYEYRVYLRV